MSCLIPVFASLAICPLSQFFQMVEEVWSLHPFTVTVTWAVSGVFMPLQKLENCHLSVTVWGVHLGSELVESSLRLLSQSPYIISCLLHHQSLIQFESRDQNQRLCQQTCVLTLQVFWAHLPRNSQHPADISYRTGKDHIKCSGLVSGSLPSVAC